MVRTSGMNGVEVGRTIDRLAHEMIEQLGVPTDYSLVGIVTGGRPIAERLADRIEESTGVRPKTGSVDITLYRDDLYTGLEKPVLGETRLPFASVYSIGQPRPSSAGARASRIRSIDAA